jgi:3-oxoacyl-[acyl-carrier-protein] synthase-1
VGLTAASSCAALRAGIARIGEIRTAHVDGEQVESVPAVGGRVPLEWLHGNFEEPEWPGHDRFGLEAPDSPLTLVDSGAGRLVEIGRPAAREALRSAGLLPAPADVRIGLALGLAEDEAAAPVAESLRADLAPAFEIAAREGRAAFWIALREGAKRLLSGHVDALLVGGLDSRIRREPLLAMAAAGTLKSATVPQGIIPGEAAGFIVLERAGAARTRGAPVLARIPVLVSESEETAVTDEPNRADALGRAFRRVRRSDPGFTDYPLVIADLNGERYRHLEWGYASLRAMGDIEGDLEIWHPADCIGDAGAGLGAVNLIWAATALREGYAGADRVMVWGASDGPARLAALVLPPEE